MKNIYISLIVWFVCNTQIFGNTFFQGENYQFKSIMFLQDSTSENESEFKLETFKDKGSFKSPGKALLYSGVLPGMGQAYMGNWLRGLIFVGLEVAAIGTWYNDNHYNNLVEDNTTKYKYYANKHWDFGRWVHDYYKWYEYDDDNPDSEWNKVDIEGLDTLQLYRFKNTTPRTAIGYTAVESKFIKIGCGDRI